MSNRWSKGSVVELSSAIGIGDKVSDIAAWTEAQLAHRPSRGPNYPEEVAGLLSLADEMSERPDAVLHKLCEVLMRQCRAQSAGVSVFASEAEDADFVWPSIAGAWAPYVNGGMPRAASPCGVVVQRDEVLLFRNVSEQFPAAAQAQPPIHELLLSPFHRDGKPVGTVWVIHHDPERLFDAEDRRLLINLARFASAAYQTMGINQDARNSSDRLASTLENAKILGLWEWDIAKDRVVADSRFANLFGVDPQKAAKGAPLEAFVSGIHPDDRDRVAAQITNTIATDAPFMSEYRVLPTTGGVGHLLARGHVERDAAGKPMRFPGLVVDITGQRAVESALHRTQDRYRALFNSIEAGFCVIEVLFADDGTPADFRYVETNPAFEALTGMVGVVGLTMGEIDPSRIALRLNQYADVAVTGEPSRFDGDAMVVDGVRWFDLYAYKVGDADDRQVAVLFTDVTDRRNIEAALRQSEEQFRTLAQTLPSQVWTAGPDGLLDWFNDRVYAFSGALQGALDGTKWTSLVHPEDVAHASAAWKDALDSGQSYETEFRLKRSDGQWRWHITRADPLRSPEGAILRWIGTNTDTHDQKVAAEALSDLNAALETRVQDRTWELMAAEEALRQAQKMEAVGQLTGGLAHDFNNLLAGISGSLELTQLRVKQGRSSEIDKYLGTAQEAVKRAAALTHRLLAFSRRQTLAPKPTDVNRLVYGMQDMIERTVGPAISVDVTGAKDLWTTRVDPSQLENALLNLCINARDAMPDGGCITIETANIHDRGATGTAALPEGQFLCLSVTDTGTGMPPEVIARVFEPFFTTKPIGEGTGLGLSMIYGFAQQSGGQIRIASEVAKGTTVSICLPRYDGEVTDEGIETSPAMLARSHQGETVLVVDDEPTLRMLITDILQDLGYRSIEAGDSAAGMKILASDRRIDLLVTDVGLPGGMNGRQMADAARVSRPDLKVLFITGYAENAVLRDGHMAPGMSVLTKPFPVEAMAARIRSMIEMKT
jgi:PAS domain S-box-containing protein